VLHACSRAHVCARGSVVSDRICLCVRSLIMLSVLLWVMCARLYVCVFAQIATVFDITLQASLNSRVAVVGPNGAGITFHAHSGTLVCIAVYSQGVAVIGRNGAAGIMSHTCIYI